MQLGQLHKIENELTELGYQILAISPDAPEKLKESIGRHEMKYQLLSDGKLELATAFGLTYALDQKTYEAYKGYGVDLVASGDQHLLPVPGIFLVGTDGTVDFTYVNPDFKVRLSPDLVLTAAQVYAKEEKKEDG